MTKIESIAEKAAEMLRSALNEESENIQTAWVSVVEDAQESESKPVLRLSFAIRLDMDANKMTTALSYGVRRKVESACDIPDGNQPQLGLSD